MSFGTFASRFAGEKSRFAWICSDEEVVKAYEESPLCGFTFTADGFEGLLMLLKETYRKEGWRLQNPQLPILFLGGRRGPLYRKRQKVCERASVHEAGGLPPRDGKALSGHAP